MDLIIKPTEACNFKCTFCSSTNIQADSPNLPLDSIYRFLKRFPDTNTIIVNGGDPLMMKPDYYLDLLKHLDDNDYKTNLSFTSNLWPFYLKPEKWIDVFLHPRVGVSTSFQYGNSRLKHDLTPYTEDEFWKVSNLFKELIGYRPPFISVISNENKHTVIDTVKLAKQMDVVCKVNYLNASGPVKTFKGIRIGSENQLYMLSDMYKSYLEIIRLELHPWEHNSQQLMKRLIGQNTICPQLRNCDDGIRSLQPGNQYYSCGSFGDDGLYGIDYESEMSGDFFTPLRNVEELQTLKQPCYSCPMFQICNGCRKTIHDLKKLNMVEQHCRGMKEIAKDIIEVNGLSDVLVPTPYVKEY